MFYYKVLDMDNELLGYGTSSNLIYYNKHSKLLLGCSEDRFQYIQLPTGIYRISWFLPEDADIKGRFPQADAFVVSQEEYERYMKEQTEKEKEV
jgi:phenolic acid decarboxylase